MMISMKNDPEGEEKGEKETGVRTSMATWIAPRLSMIEVLGNQVKVKAKVENVTAEAVQSNTCKTTTMVTMQSRTRRKRELKRLARATREKAKAKAKVEIVAVSALKLDLLGMMQKMTMLMLYKAMRIGRVAKLRAREKVGKVKMEDVAV